MIEAIIQEFKNWINVEWEPEEKSIKELKGLLEYSGRDIATIGFQTIRESHFIEAANQKLGLNKETYQNLLNISAGLKISFNYQQKQKLKYFLDTADFLSFELLLKEIGDVNDIIIKAFTPVSKETTIKKLRVILETEDRHISIINSIFSRYCFSCFPIEIAHQYFSGIDSPAYKEEFIDFVEEIYPDMVGRDAALYYVNISEDVFEMGYELGINKVLEIIENAYSRLNNHCNLIVKIPNIFIKGRSVQWKVYSDVILFAEKHILETIERPYFKWNKIQQETVDYIGPMDITKSQFNLAAQGFIFKDCFVINGIEESDDYVLQLIFEKNIRDERKVPCPECRSFNIQANSYPILNVRSWECKNPLCPDNSKYNRGKRYAFSSVQRQQAMRNDLNRIEIDSIRRWKLDCLTIDKSYELLEMALLHYSFIGDSVIYVSDKGNGNAEILDRKMIYESFSKSPSTNKLEEFKKGPFFARYLEDNGAINNDTIRDMSTLDNVEVYCGDSFHILKSMQTDSVDGAVTSPPYYNAKSYSQWPNIYCYLYDMYNIAREVYRVLKPGSIFLYNIFDYFDNEKNIVYSDMGKKRMILGAYIVDMFNRIGFNVEGNIIWNKGEIQGSRHFNQGNDTPYYQAPLNCWEHVFIFSKGEVSEQYKSIKSEIVNIKPVYKMVKGKNVLGHDAPFPEDIPNLLLRYMDQDSVILDPFSGSMTSGRAANKRGVRSINIERSLDYCQLGLNLIPQEIRY